MQLSDWLLLVIPLIFFAFNWLILRWVLRRNKTRIQESPVISRPSEPQLEASDILGWEFEYARTTASEAMQDRHAMVNFCLLAVGIVASVVVAALGEKADKLPEETSTLLTWLLCVIGWFYFLKLIRLRQAWHDSVRAMNQIKEFCIQNAQDIAPEELRKAFLWQPNTVPNPDKPWTVFHYLAMLIGFLNSVAFVVGSALLYREVSNASISAGALALAVLLGIGYF